MRIGEALGLRHDDLAPPNGQISRAPGNGNGARVKSGRPRTIPVSAGLVRLYADYLHGEYGDLDSDYVFVNLWGSRWSSLTYPAVYDLVPRLRRRTGIDFDPHWFRHTSATGMLRDRGSGRGGVQAAGSRLGDHHDGIYGHLTVEDARTRFGAGGLVRRSRGSAVTGRPAAGAPQTLVLERLMGAVRPEFRSSLLVFDADDPVFGGGACRVERCRRPARGNGLCPGHRQRWSTRAGRIWTDVRRLTDPRWQRQRPNARCRVDGCGYGSARSGMCAAARSAVADVPADPT